MCATDFLAVYQLAHGTKFKKFISFNHFVFMVLPNGDVVYYLAENGLEYPEFADAKKYGGGVKAQRTVKVQQYEQVEIGADNLPKGYEKVEGDGEQPPARLPVVTSVTEGGAPLVTLQEDEQPAVARPAVNPPTIEEASDAQLRDFLKKQGVGIGVHLMGRKKLEEKVKEIVESLQK